MRRIGILTFQRTTNYGAALQAFALQKKIKDLGFESEVIDYHNDNIDKIYKPMKIRDIKNFKHLLKFILLNKKRKIIYSKFNKFYSKYMKFSRQYDSSTIALVNTQYDVFIVGSDQVWNLNLAFKDYNYFLKFVDDNNKKNSYAASFGYLNIPKDFEDKVKNELLTFKNISVREKQGQIIVEKLINTAPEVVLDPTLLLTQEEWLETIPNCNNKYNKYILLYIVSLNDDIITFAKSLAKRNNCKLLWINNSYRKIMGIKNIKNLDPIDFLKYIKNAEYVVTTSYHGVALSVALHKQFYYGLSTEESNLNSRIQSLMSLLNINRNIDQKGINFNENINYKIIEKKLNYERMKSLKFLKKIVSDNYDKK